MNKNKLTRRTLKNTAIVDATPKAPRLGRPTKADKDRLNCIQTFGTNKRQNKRIQRAAKVCGLNYPDFLRTVIEIGVNEILD